MLVANTKGFGWATRHCRFSLCSARCTVDLKTLSLVRAIKLLVIWDRLRCQFSKIRFFRVVCDRAWIIDGQAVCEACGSVLPVFKYLLIVFPTTVFEQPT